MDVRLVTDARVEQRPVHELAALLNGDDGLVWVDIPDCDDEAVKVLGGIPLPSDGHPGQRRA